MPTYLFKCEGCNGMRPFLTHEIPAGDADSKMPVTKYCPTCRTTTNWVRTVEERREVSDRRRGDRRDL